MPATASARRQPQIPDPAEIVSLDGDQIKTAGGRFGKAAQIGTGRAPQPLLLGRADTGDGAAEKRASTKPDLDKHQRVGITHDQIDLAAAALVVFLDQ